MRLLCWIAGHFWRDTHANPFGIATRQECACCGSAREWLGGPAGKWCRTPPYHHEGARRE